MESKTADLRTQIRRKSSNSGDTQQTSDLRNPLQEAAQKEKESSHESKLKASRDVRWQLRNHVTLPSLVHVVKACSVLHNVGVLNSFKLALE